MDEYSQSAQSIHFPAGRYDLHWHSGRLADSAGGVYSCRPEGEFSWRKRQARAVIGWL
jgi:hypothetical protein